MPQPDVCRGQFGFGLGADRAFRFVDMGQRTIAAHCPLYERQFAEVWSEPAILCVINREKQPYAT